MRPSVGIVCHKDGFGCTVVVDGAATDHDIAAPASMADRGERLAWILDEAQRLLSGAGVEAARVQRAGGGKFGASAERHEVEAAVQIAAFRAGLECNTLSREQVRSTLGIAKGPGAYKTLLQREDVKARSNEVRRDQYLLALAAQA